MVTSSLDSRTLPIELERHQRIIGRVGQGKGDETRG